MTAGAHQVVIGTAGHIDHGKTALVYALTGEQTDRLTEERERGMTIDLGFAFLTDNITIIDVPGHEKFIRNMVAGVATIDCALLVVAADDGIIPQTVEHVQIMHLLGIRKGIIALTKIDLVEDDEWLSLVEADIRQSFQTTFLAEAPLVRISNTRNTGIAELKKALLEMADKVRKKEDRGYFRLPVDRVFSKSGFGTVVTGTAISGQTKVNDVVEILPQGELAKIRGIQSHGVTVSLGQRGDRLALNLASVEAGELARGTEIVTADRGIVTDRFVAHVQLLEDTRWMLKPRQRVHIHIGTAEFLARVWIPAPMHPGQEQNAIFSLENPMAITHDDRFIVRSYSPMETIGGGTVILAGFAGDWKTLRKEITTIPVAPLERFEWIVDRFRQASKSPREWSIMLQQSEETIREWITTLKLVWEKGVNIVYSPTGFKRDCDIMIQRVREFHHRHPYRKWMGRKQLMDELKFEPKWFSFIMETCVAEKKLVTEESGLRLPDHVITLQEQDKTLLQSIRSFIDRQDLAMAATKEIVSGLELDFKRIQDLLFILKDRKEIIEITTNHWISAVALDRLLDKLKTWFQTHSRLSVSDFKDLTGLSRKSAIPLLEYLDKSDYTVRVENDREAGENIHFA